LHLREKALEWLLRLEDDSSQATRKAFFEWCEQSREHVQAFLEVTVLDRQLDSIDPNETSDIETLIDQCRRSPYKNVVARDDSIPGPSIDTATRWRRMGWGLAAALAGLLLCLPMLWFLGQPAPAYTTRAGEQRSIKLEDGSVVYLNTRS